MFLTRSTCSNIFEFSPYHFDISVIKISGKCKNYFPCKNIRKYFNILYKLHMSDIVWP